MNILLIEDDLLLTQVLSHHLVEKGYTVTSAVNGREAIELIEKKLEVDLIICDLIMPITSGPAFILMIKKYYKQKLPTLVIISGVKEGESFIKKLDLAYDYFLQKPLNFNRLTEIIAQISESKH